MTDAKLKTLFGKKVLIHARGGLQLIGTLQGYAPRFGQRDVYVLFPGKAKPDRFYASKVEELKP